MRRTLDLAPILLDKREISILELISIIYNLYEIGVSNEELLEESLSNASESIKELLEELIVFVVEPNIIA